MLYKRHVEKLHESIAVQDKTDLSQSIDAIGLSIESLQAIIKIARESLRESELSTVVCDHINTSVAEITDDAGDK